VSYVPTDVEVERRNRIRLSLFAYAYEYEDDPLISDAEYDKLSYLIRKDVSTGNKALDLFFKREFAPHTGQWIHKHPELSKLKVMYFMEKKNYDTSYLRIRDIVIDVKKQEVVEI
jgi:NAD-dependent DNA ligase